jgi:hypothetical protein
MASSNGRRDRGGSVPFGYERRYDPQSGKPAAPGVAPFQASIVRAIFALSAGGNNYSQVARALNVQGILSPQGRQWDRNTIKGIVRNEEKYRGGLGFPPIL